jgi:hypothetical protein
MGMEKNVNSSILDFYILGARAEHRPDFVKETFLVFRWQMTTLAKLAKLAKSQEQTASIFHLLYSEVQ